MEMGAMCGRFSQTLSFEDIREYFQVAKALTLEPRFNVAPSQNVAAVRAMEGERSSLCFTGV